MKDKTIKTIYIIGWIIIISLISIAVAYNLKKENKESTIQVKPNYEVMYDMCKSKCSNYTTFDIANNKEVGMKVVLYQNKTIKEIECLCENNNMSRSVRLW